METESTIQPLLCDEIDKALISAEWEKLLRSVDLYMTVDGIKDNVKNRNTLLHLGGTQLQEVAYSLPQLAAVDADDKNDVYKILVDKLSEHFAPKQNSTFERHKFRKMKPDDGENFSKFLLKIRHQAKRCNFGKTEKEASETSMKDKIIDSWASLDLKKKILEKERSLDEVIEVCQVHDQITSQSTTMNVNPTSLETQTNTPVAINKIKFQNKRFERCLHIAAGQITIKMFKLVQRKM